MVRDPLWRAQGVAMLLIAEMVLHLGGQCAAGQESPSHESRRNPDTARACRDKFLTLGFNLQKDSSGGIWAHFYIHNRGRTGRLICDKMEASFSVLTPAGKIECPLRDDNSDSNPIKFVLL